MADSTDRQNAIEAAKERARQRLRETQQSEDGARVTNPRTADAGATHAALTANDQMAADQRLTESGRSPIVEDAIEQPGLGTDSGNANGDGTRSPAQSLAEGNEQLSSRLQQTASYSPETQAALDMFNQVLNGDGSGASGQVTDANGLARPGLSGGQQGIQPGIPGGGVAQETGGRQGAGYGMNEVFTQQAMKAAAEGDTAALDRLAKQVREHYGRPDPGTSSGTGGATGATGSSDGAGVGYGGAAGFDESEGVKSNVGDDWAEEYPTLAKIAKIFTGENSVAGATTKGQALQQAVDEMDANAKGSTEQPVDSEEPTAQQRAELAEWFESTTGVDPRTGGRAGANPGDGRTDPTDYTTPDTGGAPVNARDRLRGGHDPLAPGAPAGNVSEDDFDVEHSQDDVINYGEQGASANSGGTPETDTPDTERQDGPISVNIPGAGGGSTSSDLLRRHSSETSRMSDSSMQAGETRFAAAPSRASGDGDGSNWYTTQQAGESSYGEDSQVDLSGDSGAAQAEDNEGSSSRNQSGTWQEAAGEAAIDGVFGAGTSDRVQSRIDAWAARQVQDLRDWANADETTSAGESGLGADGGTGGATDTGTGSPSDSGASASGSVGSSDASGDSAPAAADDNSGGSRGRGGQPPEFVPIAGGQVRIYKDPTGNGDHIAVRDTKTGTDDNPHWQYGEEVVRGGRQVSDLLSRYTPSASTGGTGASDQPAGGGSPTNPDGQGDGDRSGGRGVDWGPSGVLGIPIGYKEGDGVIAADPNDAPGGSAAYRWLQDKVEETARPGFDAYQRRIDDLAGTTETSEGAPPSPGTSAHNPSLDGGNPRDPLDTNPTDQVNRRAWDMFGARGSGGAMGTGTGTQGAGYDGTNGNGADSNSSDTGSAPNARDGFDESYSPTTPWQLTTPGGTGDSTSDGNSSGSATGGSAGGDRSGSDDGGSGDRGTTGADSDAEGATGTVQIDYDGVVIEYEEDNTDSSGEEETPGVATSYDPTGDNYQPTPEDLERAMAYQNWLRGGRTPIDPDEGGYREDFGDGSTVRRWGAPGVDQPGPFGNEGPSGDPGEIVFGGNQGGYTDPPDDQVAAPQQGPSTGTPLDNPTLGVTLQDPTGTNDDDDAPEDQPLQMSVVGTINVSTTPSAPPPPGTGYVAFNPDSYHPTDGSDSGNDDEGGLFSRAGRGSDSSPFRLVDDDGTPDRYDDDDNPFD